MVSFGKEELSDILYADPKKFSPDKTYKFRPEKSDPLYQKGMYNDFVSSRPSTEFVEQTYPPQIQAVLNIVSVAFDYALGVPIAIGNLKSIEEGVEAKKINLTFVPEAELSRRLETYARKKDAVLDKLPFRAVHDVIPMDRLLGTMIATSKKTEILASREYLLDPFVERTEKDPYTNRIKQTFRVTELARFLSYQVCSLLPKKYPVGPSYRFTDHIFDPQDGALVAKITEINERTQGVYEARLKRILADICEEYIQDKSYFRITAKGASLSVQMGDSENAQEVCVIGEHDQDPLVASFVATAFGSFLDYVGETKSLRTWYDDPRMWRRNLESRKWVRDNPGKAEVLTKWNSMFEMKNERYREAFDASAKFLSKIRFPYPELFSNPSENIGEGIRLVFGYFQGSVLASLFYNVDLRNEIAFREKVESLANIYNWKLTSDEVVRLNTLFKRK